MHEWFKRELQLIHPDLRLVWGREAQGVELWVVERRVPPAVHQHCLEEFHRMFPGEDRFFDQKLTGDQGQIVGRRHFDRVPEWTTAHIVADRNFDLDDPRSYREPNAQDLMSLRRWLFEFKNAEEQIRVLREERETREAQQKADRVDFLTKEIKNGRTLWGDDTIDFGKVTALEGTEL